MMFDQCDNMKVTGGTFTEIGKDSYQWGNTFNTNNSQSHNTNTTTNTGSYNARNAASSNQTQNNIDGSASGWSDHGHGQRMNGAVPHANKASPPVPDPMIHIQQAKAAKAMAQEMKRSLPNRPLEQNMGAPSPHANTPAPTPQYASPRSNEVPLPHAARPLYDSRYPTSPLPSQHGGMATPSPLSRPGNNPFRRPATAPATAPQAFSAHSNNPFLNPAFLASHGMVPPAQMDISLVDD